MISVYKDPKNVETNQDQWWFVYEEASKNIIVEPQQCSGSTTGPHIMVIADTKEELDQYIVDNGLEYKTEQQMDDLFDVIAAGPAQGLALS